MVEDSPGTAASTRRALSGYSEAVSLVVRTTGADALHHLQTCRIEDLPDIILMDLNLPDMGGLELLAKIRGAPRTQAIPVNVLTGSDAEKDRFKAYAAGVNSFIKKPVSYGALEKVLHAVLDYWFKVVMLPPR